MSEKKELGRIAEVRFGSGGYQEACLGVSFEFSLDGASVGDFWGFWKGKPPAVSGWTEVTQLQRYGETMKRIENLLREAKVSELHDLVGKPIEVTFENLVLTSWRILTEVL
jgi:hypothetical protein